MEVYFKPSFIRDFKKLPADTRREVRYICMEIFPKFRGLRDFTFYPIKSIKGFKGYFRIKIGDYRIGLKKTAHGGIEFVRVKHRKDIYKHFP